MVLHELEDAGANGRVGPNVALFGEPTFHYQLGAFRLHIPTRGLTRAFVVGAVVSDSCGRVATKAAAGFPLQR